jgi:1-acyl-sn-glycerol-3-phosphate acyltransferase
MIKFIFCNVLGWKIIGETKPVKKCVIIVAPHTHWLDFFIAIPVRRILNLEINFIGKKELFFFPLNYILKYLGGFPVNRNSNSKTVDIIALKFSKKDLFRLALSPEGTRKKVNKWKTGFYYIAKKANVPIVSVSMDAKKKEVVFSKPFYPTNDINKDFELLKKFYEGIVGIVAENS